MEIFVGVIVVAIAVIRESIARKKADDYANMVVRRYK